MLIEGYLDGNLLVLTAFSVGRIVGELEVLLLCAIDGENVTTNVGDIDGVIVLDSTDVLSVLIEGLRVVMDGRSIWIGVGKLLLKNKQGICSIVLNC